MCVALFAVSICAWSVKYAESQESGENFSDLPVSNAMKLVGEDPLTTTEHAVTWQYPALGEPEEEAITQTSGADQFPRYPLAGEVSSPNPDTNWQLEAGVFYNNQSPVLDRPENPSPLSFGASTPFVAPNGQVQPPSQSFNAPSQDFFTAKPDLQPVFANPINVAPVRCAQCQSTSCRGCRQSNCGCGGIGCERCQLRGRTRLGRFLQGVYAGICNPDPCYQSQWTMLANASLFTDAARPQSRQRFRWDFNDEYLFPDRAEFLWARSGRLGPAAERSINFHELSVYVETGSEKFSFFVETPYRSIDLESGGHFAGFGDITTGTKTLLHDTELLQIGFQFETQIISASPSKGLSNGHVSLEPSLLFGVQVSPRSFFQAQIGEWIPIAGDPTFAGALLRYSASYNRTLIETASNTSLIGTIEFSGLSFQDGAFTDPTTLQPVSASNESIGMLGPGFRLNICDKFNIGFGAQFGVTEISPQALYRTEIQFRH